MSQAFRLAVAQITSTDKVDDNLRIVESLFSSASERGADLTVFPENTLYFRLQTGEPLKAVKLQGPEIRQLENVVRFRGTHLMLTTAVVHEDSGRVRNSTLWLAPGENAREVYSKIHLFDVDVEGAPAVRESEHFLGGETPAEVVIEGWKFGLSICYDLRFAELYGRYAQNVDVILVPSAFLVPTGAAHWHVLLRARAIENQCYVAAPAQSGEHLSGTGAIRKTYGHSLVVDPWGTVQTELTKSPEVTLIELSREPIERARRQIPMASHRRLV
ncbi:MAG: carbon-nitrogen hydrolase family protein [Bdellovibrionales bacterium]